MRGIGVKAPPPIHDVETTHATSATKAAAPDRSTIRMRLDAGQVTAVVREDAFFFN